MSRGGPPPPRPPIGGRGRAGGPDSRGGSAIEWLEESVWVTEFGDDEPELEPEACGATRPGSDAAGPDRPGGEAGSASFVVARGNGELTSGHRPSRQNQILP